jgi:hypothetical protein
VQFLKDMIKVVATHFAFLEPPTPVTFRKDVAGWRHSGGLPKE